MYLRSCLMILGLMLTGTSAAQAHPHVWIETASDLVWEGSKLKEIRHHWTFDEMFSTFAVEGYDTDKDGKYTSQELKDLAETNVTSLAEYDYFTIIKNNGSRMKLKLTPQYDLEWKEGRLVLNFSLQPEKQEEIKSLAMSISDATMFVAFSFSEKPATLLNAPQSCTSSMKTAKSLLNSESKKLGEEFFATLGTNSSFADDFTNTITITCP